MNSTNETLTRTDNTVLELLVNNHPGVMMHICSLFARRAFNMDGIACVPVDDNSRSRMWIRVRDDERLDQVVKQLTKLEDVLSVRRHSASHETFQKVEGFFTEGDDR